MTFRILVKNLQNIFEILIGSDENNTNIMFIIIIFFDFILSLFMFLEADTYY